MHWIFLSAVLICAVFSPGFRRFLVILSGILLVVAAGTGIYVHITDRETNKFANKFNSSVDTSSANTEKDLEKEWSDYQEAAKLKQAEIARQKEIDTFYHAVLSSAFAEKDINLLNIKLQYVEYGNARDPLNETSPIFRSRWRQQGPIGILLSDPNANPLSLGIGSKLGEYGDQFSLVGRISNNSIRYDLSKIKLQIKILDCQSSDCQTIGETNGSWEVNVPKEQSRDIKLSLKFGHGFNFKGQLQPQVVVLDKIPDISRDDIEANFDSLVQFENGE